MERRALTDSLDPNRVPSPLAGPFEAERKRTINQLTRAFERGVMTVDEYDERIELASTASTGAELEVLVQDLDASSKAVEAFEASPLEVESIGTFLGNKNRQGTWRLARVLKVNSIFGTVRLDLGEAKWPASDAVVSCFPFFGTIVLRVPPDVDVQVQAGAFLGDVDNRIQATGASKTKSLVIRGRVIFGSLRIETVYPKGIGRK